MTLQQDQYGRILKMDNLYQKELAEQLNKINSDTRKQFSFVLNGSGCRQKSNLLALPFFRICICFGLFSLHERKPIGFMVTASHNPADDNGIKIGYVNEQIISKEILKQVQKCVNDTKQFQRYLQKYQIKQSKEDFFCFLGRDCRKSSPSLIKIAIQTLELLNIKFINIGICTTPQLYTFSQFLIQNKKTKTISEEQIFNLKNSYTHQILDSFQKTMKLLNQNQLQKSKIVLDFSNGSGAVSFKLYQQSLKQYFNITKVHDSDFDFPNLKCGAEYIQKNWYLTQNQFYKQFDYCVFFDGDSDRIIIKQKSIDFIIDGNYLLVLYIKTIKKAIQKLQNLHLLTDKLTLSSVSNFLINFGVTQKLKKLNIPLFLTDVGIQNVFEQVQKSSDISVFFEPNGHGGIFFNQLSIKTLNKILQKQPNNPQIVLLTSLNNILRNNSRGYGLHNMFVYFICKNYLKQDNLPIFQMSFEAKKNFHIKNDFFHIFKNDKLGKCQLIEPTDLKQQIQKISNKYQNYQIIVRNSATQRGLLRVVVQGHSHQKCQQIISQIQNSIKTLKYLLQN